ncbi:hypothetical protein [Streptomyces zhaozhouensis]|uniref:hypothetical protein n=1 Tax=Streptomyces zhaozhouensis TaxID=1300267 RepID=UPI001141BA07|nr:hypothetical protein [Streptomyces zhaozhouensis]
MSAVLLGACSSGEEEPEREDISTEERGWQLAQLELQLMTPSELRELCRVYRDEGAAGLRALPRAFEGEVMDAVVEVFVDEAVENCPPPSDPTEAVFP